MLPQNVHTSPSSSLTKVATGLCIATALVSFLGYLPRFQPYTIFQLSNIFNKFPKIWILLTSSFYTESLFNFMLHCVALIFSARIIEPIWGSKEFLRFVILSSIYPNILIFIFVLSFYYATGQNMVLDRIFLTNSALSNALFIGIAKALYDVSLPTQFGNFKPKYIPFFSFTLSVFFASFSKCDSLLGNICGSFWAILYIKYLQPHNGIRGTSTFTVMGLLPNRCCTLCDELEGDEFPEGQPGQIPPPGPNPMYQQQNMQQQQQNNNNNRRNNNRNNNDNQFIGRPHRIG